eukprot:9191608-Alexandrium_andersonii.AAC.1
MEPSQRLLECVMARASDASDPSSVAGFGEGAAENAAEQANREHLGANRRGCASTWEIESFEVSRPLCQPFNAV